MVIYRIFSFSASILYSLHMAEALNSNLSGPILIFVLVFGFRGFIDFFFQCFNSCFKFGFCFWLYNFKFTIKFSSMETTQ